MSASSAVLLPHAPSSVSLARRRLGEDLRAHGIREPVVGDATLVLSELLSNAIRHARPLPGEQIRVNWTVRRGSLEVAVSDGGAPTRPRPEQPALPAPGGRGLGIVERLSRRWGVRTDERGTTVWAELPTSRNGVSRRRSSRALSNS